jgi:hypothetical protein
VQSLVFYDIQKKDQILAFLDTKIKSGNLGPDRKWITTWNDYLGRLKYLSDALLSSKKQ